MAVAGGDIACPKAPANDGRLFGVLAVIVLLLERGRRLEPVCAFCNCDRGCFLSWEIGLDTEGALVGVAAELAGTAALTLRLPGAVIEPRGGGPPRRRGVDGAA